MSDDDVYDDKKESLSLSNLKFDLNEPEKEDDTYQYDEEYWDKYEMCIICHKAMNDMYGPHDTDDTKNEVVNVHPNDKSKKHLFHRGCILEWCERSENCPICRSTINCQRLEWQEKVPSYELVVKKGGRRYKRKSIRRKTRKHKRRSHKRGSHKKRTHRRR